MKTDYTCKNVHPYADDNMNNGTTFFQCSECGCKLDPEPDSNWGIYLNVDGTWYAISFCPNCGRKVVE